MQRQQIRRDELHTDICRALCELHRAYRTAIVTCVLCVVCKAAVLRLRMCFSETYILSEMLQCDIYVGCGDFADVGPHGFLAVTANWQIRQQLAVPRRQLLNPQPHHTQMLYLL